MSSPLVLFLSGLSFKLKMELVNHLGARTLFFLSLCIDIYMNMGKINNRISDELEERFRRAVAIHWGVRKGVISKSLEEAIELWIKSKSKPATNRKTDLGWSGKG
jgi:hypothetical protein